MMFRALIVDDERAAREGLREMLQSDAELVIDDCADGVEAIHAIASQVFDMVFLDIQMPVVDGFGVIDQLGAEAMPVIVFITAYEEHAIHAFDACALDYLLKPFSAERLAQAVRRAKEASRQRKLPKTHEPVWLCRVPVRSGNSLSFVDLANVGWIEADAYYARLWTGKRFHLTRRSLTSLELALDPSKFLRVHRRAFVNLAQVESIKRVALGRYRLVLRDGSLVPLSRDRMSELSRLLAGLGPV